MNVERLQAMEIMGQIATELVGKIAEMVGARPVFASDVLSQQELLTAVKELKERAEKAEADVETAKRACQMADEAVARALKRAADAQAHLTAQPAPSGWQPEVIASTAFMAGVQARQLQGVNGPWTFPPFDPGTCAATMYRDAFDQWWKQHDHVLATLHHASGWPQRIAAMNPFELALCFFCGANQHRIEGNELVEIERPHKPDCLWQNAVDAGQPAKDARPLSEGALEAAFREGYDFGQVDRRWDVVAPDGAWSRSATRQNAKDGGA